MKVLVSAYACAPGRGSEPEVGLRAVLACAARHETWVLTREKNVEALRQTIARELPTRVGHVHVVGLDLSPLWQRVKRWGPAGLLVYYDRWQRRAACTAVALHDDVGFDVVHHVTFAAYWSRAGVLCAGPPAVWGPVGGGAQAPWQLLPVLGPAGVARAGVRRAAQRLLHSRLAGAGRRDLVVLVQNPQTARAVGRPSRVVPNAVAVDVRPPVPPPAVRQSTIVVVGRLVPFKAAVLAVSAMRWVTHPGAQLLLCGEGPEHRRLERAIRRWALHDRVQLLGALGREPLLELVAGAGVLLHPSLHEDAGLAVAEALALQTPVVCLDHAGPAELTRWWPQSPATLVPPHSPRRTARALAAAVDRHLGCPPPVPDAAVRPVESFASVLLTAYAQAAAPREPGA